MIMMRRPKRRYILIFLGKLFFSFQGQGIEPMHSLEGGHDAVSLTNYSEPNLPPQEEIKKQVKAERQRHQRLRAAVNTMLKTTLVQTVKMHGSQKPETKKLWSQLLDIVVEPIQQMTTVEVHYLHLDRHECVLKDLVPFPDRQAYEIKCLESKGHLRIIPIVIFRPHMAMEAPIAIHMHGGPKSIAKPSSISPLYMGLLQLGYVVMLPNYRGSIVSSAFADLLPGHEQEFPAEDLQATISYAKTLSFYQGKIVLSGVSYGTYLNTLCLSKLAPDLSGVFLHTGLYERLNPSPFDQLENYPKDLPTLLVSGEKDENSYLSLCYAQALSNICSDLQICGVKKGGHHLVSKSKSWISYKLKPAHLTNPRAFQESSKFKELFHEMTVYYNTSALVDYFQYMTEFFDRLGYNSNPNQSSFLKNSLTVPKSHLESIQILKRVLRGIRKTPHLETRLMRDPHLLKAPYTSSEAHMMIVLGERASEMKGELLEAELHTLIRLFLEKYDEDKPKIFKEYFKAYPLTEQHKSYYDKLIAERTAESGELKNLIFNIIKKEHSYRQNCVLYHGTNSTIGFLYDVYSAWHRVWLLQGESGEDLSLSVSRLRILDDSFLSVPTLASFLDLMNRMHLFRNQAGVLFNCVAGYKEVGIAAQFFLFGSYKYWFNSTFFRYFRQNSVATRLELEELLTDMFSHFGIPLGEDLKRIISHYVQIYETYIHADSGRLLQFFIPRNKIEKCVYASEVGGVKLSLSSSAGWEKGVRFLIQTLVENPQKCESFLEANRNNFVSQEGWKDRDEFNQRKKGLKYINSLEARGWLNPKVVGTPRFCQIFNYHIKDPKSGYLQALDQRIVADVHYLIWLKRKLPSSVMIQKPPLLKLVDLVSTGGGNAPQVKRSFYTLYDCLSCGAWDDAWKYQDQLLKLDSHHHSLLYRLLQEHKFKAAQWVLDHGESINRLDEQNMPMMYELLLEAPVFVARWLLDRGLDLSYPLAIDEPLLHSLLRFNRFSMMRFLVKFGVSIDEVDSMNETVLHRLIEKQAVEKKEYGLVRFLLDRKKAEGRDGFLKYLNLKNEEGASALGLAILHHDGPTAEFLLDEGSNGVDFFEVDEGDSYLMAAIVRDLPTVSELILNQLLALDPSQRFNHLTYYNLIGDSVPYYCLYKKAGEFLLKLFKAGLDPFLIDGRRETILMSAIYHKNDVVIEYIFQQEKKRESVEWLHYLNYQDHRECCALEVAWEHRQDLIHRLVERGADPFYMPEGRAGSLFFSIYLQRRDLIDYVISKRDPLEADSFTGYLNKKSPGRSCHLALALQKDLVDVADQLYDLGARCHCVNYEGKTDLIRGVEKNSLGFVRSLLMFKKKEGPEVFKKYFDHRDRFGKSAMDYARAKECTKMAEVLEEYESEIE